MGKLCSILCEVSLSFRPISSFFHAFSLVAVVVSTAHSVPFDLQNTDCFFFVFFLQESLF